MKSDALDQAVTRPAETAITAPRHGLPRRLLAAIGGALSRWWRGYRGEAAVLNARDDMLKDMGLTRAEIEHWLSGRPYL